MSYFYERLGPGRFQALCAALVTRENPRAQCLPFGQGDGGRDQVVYLDSRRQVVYQDKFTEHPDRVRDPAGWLGTTLRQEAPKIQQLARRGVSKYYLITNVTGSATIDAGSIDRMQEMIGNLPIEASCLWRTDLDARLDNAWEVKWSFPEVLAATDLLGALVAPRLSEDVERRTRALQAYLAERYDKERLVRFKQIDLQNDLFGLFVDLPIVRKGARLYVSHRWDSTVDSYLATASWVGAPQGRRMARISERLSFEPAPRRSTARGAAQALLEDHVPERLVLEGAPGQGKSTVVQYVCQIHRLRLLPPALTSSGPPPPAAHLSSPLRLPLKVDLRDLAAWLSGSNLFSSGVSVPEQLRTVEGFLAADIESKSGGARFSVSDLQAVVQASAVLLVLDGLDEVPDLGLRRRIVEAVTTSVTRLRALSGSLRCIVTSRPAAYANSPGFPEDDFEYFALGFLGPDTTAQYSSRWAAAKRLDEDERRDVQSTLTRRLEEPHLRELARNPMQLAILLTLIRTRGESLPDQRTALYDSYVSLFFDREAEKDKFVRENRPLLIDVHRYLGWLLHSEAEQGDAGAALTGSISTERLVEELRTYLAKEGRDPVLAHNLFRTTVERVVFLVARLEGAYEFEVQPLREYFCARHLYETAPASRAGAIHPGDTTERFAALARSPYWLNVARFYAGHYNKGELPGLVWSVQGLKQDNPLLVHPRVLGLMLLTDWVFEQDQRALQEMVRTVLDPIGIRMGLSGGGDGALAPPIPEACGRPQALAQLLGELSRTSSTSYRKDVVRALRLNARGRELEDWWRGERKGVRSSASRTIQWLRTGASLGVLGSLRRNEAAEVAGDPRLRRELASLLVASGDFGSFVELVEEDVVRATLDEPHATQHATRGTNDSLAVLNWFLSALGGTTGEGAVPGYIAAREAADRLLHASGPHVDRVKAIIEPVGAPRFGIEEWITSLQPWNDVVEGVREQWGDGWLLFACANRAAGIRSRVERGRGALRLLDSSVPLCIRARAARLRGGDMRWWSRQTELARSDEERGFVSLLMLTWLSNRALAEGRLVIDELLKQLRSDVFERVLTALGGTPTNPSVDPSAGMMNVRRLGGAIGPRFVCALASPARNSSWRGGAAETMAQYDGSEAILIRCAAEASAFLANNDGKWWPTFLKNSRRAARLGVDGAVATLLHAPMPQEVAREVMAAPTEYPLGVLTRAERMVATSELRGQRTVRQIARSAKWFS